MENENLSRLSISVAVFDEFLITLTKLLSDIVTMV